MDAYLRKMIREVYRDIMPLIMESTGQIDPYVFNFDMPMTPIESNVWYDIRVLGLPFYMQFPVGPYFIDFADPIKKIGIEVDGREWHQDSKADEKRERELNGHGWTIIRIPGYKTFKQVEEQEYTESHGILLDLREGVYCEPRQPRALTGMAEIMQSVTSGILARY